MALILELVNYQGNAPAAPTTKVFGARGGTLGRAPDSSWILADPEKYISGTHAVIRYENGLYYIEDTSTNGVFINNTEEPIGRGCKVELNDGDVVYIGEYQISVHIAEEQEKTANLISGECTIEGDDVLVKQHDSDGDKDQVSMRHISYLDSKFGDQPGESEITLDHEALDRLIEDQAVLPDDASNLSRADQSSQENADNQAKAPLTDKTKLCETHAIEAPEQATVPKSPAKHVRIKEELNESD